MVVEGVEANQIHNEAQNRNDDDFCGLNLGRLINALNRFNENRKCHKTKENGVGEARKDLYSAISIRNEYPLIILSYP